MKQKRPGDSQQIAPLTVVQISDCHLFADNTKQGYESVNPYLSLQAVLQQVAQIHPDLVLVTGDISGDDSEQSYLHFLTLWNSAAINSQLMLLPGNHDCPETMLSVFQPDQLWHRGLEIKDWMILGLNTKGQGTKGELDQQQWADIQQKITASEQHVLLAMHHHPVSANSWMDRHNWPQGQQVIEWTQQQAQIKAMVYGHIHTDKCDYVGHIPVWSCPSSCWQWQTSVEFATSDQLSGFRVLELWPDGSVESQVKRVTL